MEDPKGELERKLARLLERRKGACEKTEAALANAGSARTKRDQLTAEIKKLKEARKAAADEARAITAKLKDICGKAGNIEAVGPTAELRKQFERLEWAFQTHTGPYSEELRMWREMGRLDALLKKAAERDGALKEGKETLAKLASARRLHDKTHSDVMLLSEECGKAHAEMVKWHEQASELRKELGAFDAEITALKKERYAINSTELTAKQAERSELAEAERKRAEAEKELLERKAQEVREKIKGGKKLTGDDLFIMQKAKIGFG